VALTVRGDDAFGAQEEDKAFEQGFIACQADSLEAIVGLLVRAFVIEPRLAYRGDDDPVAREIDGVAIRLVYGGHAPAGKRAVQRVAGALAFEDGYELFIAFLEAALDGIGELAVHLKRGAPGKGCTGASPEVGRNRLEAWASLPAFCGPRQPARMPALPVGARLPGRCSRASRN
jgi:hypothetical protein